MLHKLVLEHVGPAERLALDPVAPRLNLLTGDNGLGKSFLLEAAWWGLTGSWNDQPGVPSAPNARIEHHVTGANGVVPAETRWDVDAQIWRGPPEPGSRSMVIYARADGSFAVWDPLRNRRMTARADGGRAESPATYLFSTAEVVWGLRRRVQVAGQEREEVLCLGLVDEWREWQRASDWRFELLKRLLAALGPDGEPLEPGDLIRPSVDDARVIPTVRMPYGQDVPITYAPAGVQRMCRLAYLLTWALTEHEAEAKARRAPLVPAVVLMVDELETHLHPRWQRTVLPGLMHAVSMWRSPPGSPPPGERHPWIDQRNVPFHAGSFVGQRVQPQVPMLQFVVATHSPLVLASVEPLFDSATDALWKLDLVHGAVTVERDAWHKRGDAGMWLASDVFDETSAYSREAEAAMVAGAALMSDEATTEAQADAHRAVLRGVLADTDPFWLGWRAWRRSKGWTP